LLPPKHIFYDCYRNTGAFCGVKKAKRFAKVHFTLHRQQPENDKQNVDVATPGKISADAHVCA